MSRSRRFRRDIFANKNRVHTGKVLLVICSAVIIVAGIGGWIYMLVDKDHSMGFLALGGVKQPQAGGVLQPQQNIIEKKSTTAQATSDSALGAPNITKFSKLYYYEADKLRRYQAYESANKEFSPEEVVWRVNANLDLPFFTDIKIIKDVDRFPPLLNKYNKLPDDYVPEGLTELAKGLLVTAETKESILEMAAAAKKDGYTLRFGSAYRTMSYQAGLYEKYKRADGEEKADTYSARPGHSEHHTGLTVDLVAPDGTLTNFRGTVEAEWVAKNAHMFGFIVRYTSENEDVTGYNNEPWHITYVGKQTSMTMYNRGYGSLEEYFVKCVDHREPH